MSFVAGDSFHGSPPSPLRWSRYWERLQIFWAEMHTRQFWRKDFWGYLGLCLLSLVIGAGILLYVAAMWLGPMLPIALSLCVAIPVGLLYGLVAGLITFFVSVWVLAILGGLSSSLNDITDIKSDRQYDAQLSAVRYARSRPHEVDMHCLCWSCQNPGTSWADNWADEPVQWPNDTLLWMPIGRWMAASARCVSYLSCFLGNKFIGVVGKESEWGPFPLSHHILVERDSSHV